MVLRQEIRAQESTWASGCDLSITEIHNMHRSPILGTNKRMSSSIFLAQNPALGHACQNFIGHC